MLLEWMDLVVWGHEQKCLIDVTEFLVGTFRISQPDSLVATSLVPCSASGLALPASAVQPPLFGRVNASVITGSFGQRVRRFAATLAC